MRLRIPLLLALAINMACWSSARAENRILPFNPFSKAASSGNQATSTPTVFAKMSSSTKRFVNNTKSIFSPKKKSKSKSATGLVSRQKPPEPGFFHKLFHPEPPPPPRTIEEWMSLKQIHP
jgi:hypothetical protein